MRYHVIFFFVLFFPHLFLDLSAMGNNELHIKNKSINRLVVVENGRISTLSFRLSDYPFNFVSIEKNEPGQPVQTGVGNIQEFRIWRGPNPKEFSFRLNDEEIDGLTGWKVVSTKIHTEGDTTINQMVIAGESEKNKGLELTLTYTTYGDLPLIRKSIGFTNRGNSTMKIESLDVESLNVPWGETHNIVYHSYGRYKAIGPFTGSWDDPLVICHDPYMNRGIVVGNEFPGVLKRISVCEDGRTHSSGTTRVNQDFAFRKWIKPGDTWHSNPVFSGLYVDHNPRRYIETTVSDFVRRYMGIRLAAINTRPAFVYNTWNPFRREVNEGLIKELAGAAAECGIEEFIIDDGWQVGFGDWEIDYKKFPNGLKPVFDYIKSKGMKPGLWLCMGAASANSMVYQQHPEWFVKYSDGKHVNLHDKGTDRFSACFTTGWKDYIKEKILNLVKEHGLEYVKLDFAIVASAYRYDNDVSGCFATGHPHTDREESYLEIYRRAWEMFDELHQEAPDLFIDCTFETMGKLQLIDFDMCKHAEGNWLSNFEEPAPDGSLRVRQMGWWRTGAIPATALVIGNQSLDDEHALYSYKSLAGSLPIMLGDPRALSPQKRNEFKTLANWLRQMENKHQVFLFRQDLPGFGEPGYSYWDGFQRINTQSGSGGIIGVFRHFSNVKEKWVTVNYLIPNQKYRIINAATREVVANATGEELLKNGFKVTFESEFQGELYEVTAE